jgi:hypothetical protein
MSLTREQILAAADRKTEAVEVPEWGGTVHVRSLSGAERDALEWAVKQAAESGGLGQNARARFAAAFICDEFGAALFTPDDIQALGEKSGSALDRIWNAGSRLNALGDDKIEVLAKN